MESFHSGRGFRLHSTRNTKMISMNKISIAACVDSQRNRILNALRHLLIKAN